MMIICQKCSSYLPLGTKFCNTCGYQIDELPIVPPIAPGNMSYASPNSTSAPDNRSEEKAEEFVGAIAGWENASPTEVSSYPVHGNHHQPIPTYGDHHQPLPTYGNHHQPIPTYGDHHQALPAHADHYQALPSHGKHLKKAAHSSYQVIGVSSLVVASVIIFTSVIVYFNSLGAPKPVANTSTSNITLVTSGNAIPGQMLQVVGNHFPAGQTVIVTVDGQPLNHNGATVYTSYSSALSLYLVSFSSTNASGTPITVQADGTFTITMRIESDWAVGSTHHLSVNNQQGKELKSLNFTVEGNQPPSPSISTPTVTPPPTSTPTTSTTTAPTPTPSPVQRTLTAQQTQSQTVNATGKGTTPGTQAIGTLYIVNHGPALHLVAGTILTNTAGCAGRGLQVSLDSAVNLASAIGGSRSIVITYPSTTVSIHVVQAGVAGNIQDCRSTTPYAFEYCSTSPTCGPVVCTAICSNWATYDTNGGFSGGTDAQAYTFVQQSDIDTAANSLKAATQQSTVANIKSQLHSNEHLVGDPQCSYTVTQNHAANDHAANVTVTVQATCMAKAST